MKIDHLPKKPKVFPESVVGLRAKMVILIGLGKGKGLMTGPAAVTDKPPVLLREDSKYAME